jgi:hypothetical protein
MDNKYMDLKLGPAKPELERLTVLFGTQFREEWVCKCGYYERKD